mmetsp:Transcript_14371/g.49969  ORF Transcript_14371/g.49969 Transcript_14371/m.49969 type:complete len:201 (-) Transcript_14371:117-719(-)
MNFSPPRSAGSPPAPAEATTPSNTSLNAPDSKPFASRMLASGVSGDCGLSLSPASAPAGATAISGSTARTRITSSAPSIRTGTRSTTRADSAAAAAAARRCARGTAEATPLAVVAVLAPCDRRPAEPAACPRPAAPSPPLPPANAPTRIGSRSSVGSSAPDDLRGGQPAADAVRRRSTTSSTHALPSRASQPSAQATRAP